MTSARLARIFFEETGFTTTPPRLCEFFFFVFTGNKNFIVKDNALYKLINANACELFQYAIGNIAKEYTIPAKVSGSSSKYTFKGTFYVNRIDFKVGKKSETVPDKMKIVYELPVSKKTDK
jgi:hypothetical protein